MIATRPDTRDAEQHEVDALLASGIFSRAPNLHRFFEFVCRKYFDGKAHEIKEYSIAVEALNRHEDFNPQIDTIVRVTAHALRRRLDQYYREEGAAHPIRISLPPGSYAPKFIDSGIPEYEKSAPVPPVAEEEPAASGRSGRWVFLVVGMFALGAVAMALVEYLSHRPSRAARADSAASAPIVPIPLYTNTVRFLPGQGRSALVDAAAQTWMADSFCTGGETFSHPDENIAGTDDPALFNGGRSGRFRCMLPAPPGTYELHLYFADTFHGQEGTRQVGYVINGGSPQLIDVVDETGASNSATEKIYTDVHPRDDGKVHLDFVTNDSFVNAVELIPGTPGRMLPLRILAGRAVYRDQKHQVWLPDRFFSGGRRTYRAEGLPAVTDPGRFQYERFGHFSYWLPVVPDAQYSLTLYFAEGWYGAHNGGTGGIGSRVFDVFCNGTTLLTHFDILKDNPEGYSIKTFRHVKPTAQGKLELFFTPVTNYPLLDALEVEQESVKTR